MQLSPYFALAEMLCPCGCGFGGQEPELNRLTRLANGPLESIRAHFGGVPVHVDCAARCPAHNASVGGAAHSQHLLGNAADIVIPGIEPQAVFNYARTVPAVGGAHAYLTEGFTHVDQRPRIQGQITTWNG